MNGSPELQSTETLWLGVHKTGTTFLQKSLDLSQAELQAAGVHYMELSEFRRLFTRPLLHPDHPDAPAAPVKLRPGQSQNLVFDENILALVQHALGKAGLYPDAARRARLVADHLGLKAPRLVLGLRKFSTFLPSLYCEALKSTPFRRFHAFCATPVEKMSWDNLVGRLAREFPQSEILVYTAEALRGHEKGLLSLVTGLPAEAFTLQPGTERQGFSHKAVRGLHDLQKIRAVTREDVQAYTRHFPRGPEAPAFDPWKPEERVELDRLYAADLARLAARPNLRLLDPELAAL